VELKPVRHAENDACEEAEGPPVRLKLRADVDGRSRAQSAAKAQDFSRAALLSTGETDAPVEQ
jgi:hypothetical protein